MKKYFVYYIFLVFSIIIISLNNGRAQYVPMNIYLFLAPFLLLFSRNINRQDLLPILLIGSIALTMFVHPNEFRLSTVAYSIMFVISYIYFTKLVRSSSFSYLDLLKLSRFVVLAYTIVLLFQHLGILFHLPIINENPGIEYDSFKVNSLSNEPSHTGPIVAISFFCYIKMKELQLGIKRVSFRTLFIQDKWVIISFFYTMLGSMSVTCVLSMLIISLYFVSKRHLLTGILFISVLVISVIFSDNSIGERIRTLLPTLLLLNPQTLYYVDPSSTARIGPIMTYILEFSPFNVNCWFGYGCDYGTRHVMHYMTGNYVEDEFGDIGGVINFIYNYGMISFVLFLSMIVKITKIKSFMFFIYITLFLVSPFNVHMTWLFIMYVYCINYFRNQEPICTSTSIT